VRVIAKLFLPLSVLFGLYLAVEAPLGAAGGVAGGLVICGAAACHHSVFGATEARRAAPLWFWRMMIGLGVTGLAIAIFAPLSSGAPLLTLSVVHEGGAIANIPASVRLLELAMLAITAGAGGTVLHALATELRG
jgi:hypothetical protein